MHTGMHTHTLLGPMHINIHITLTPYTHTDTHCQYQMDKDLFPLFHPHAHIGYGGASGFIHLQPKSVNVGLCLGLILCRLYLILSSNGTISFREHKRQNGQESSRGRPSEPVNEDKWSVLSSRSLSCSLSSSSSFQPSFLSVPISLLFPSFLFKIYVCSLLLSPPVWATFASHYSYITYTLYPSYALQDSSGMRLWKRKWFVLADFCLFYYKGESQFKKFPKLFLCVMSAGSGMWRNWLMFTLHTVPPVPPPVSLCFHLSRGVWKMKLCILKGALFVKELKCKFKRLWYGA